MVIGWYPRFVAGISSLTPSSSPIISQKSQKSGDRLGSQVSSAIINPYDRLVIGLGTLMMVDGNQKKLS